MRPRRGYSTIYINSISNLAFSKQFSKSELKNGDCTYKINITRLQRPQRPLHTSENILRIIPRIIHLNHTTTFLLLLRDLHARELCRDDHLVAAAPFGHPLAEPLLALAVLVANGRVDKVPALLVEVVEDLEGRFARAFA